MGHEADLSAFSLDDDGKASSTGHCWAVERKGMAWYAIEKKIKTEVLFLSAALGFPHYMVHFILNSAIFVKIYI